MVGEKRKKPKFVRQGYGRKKSLDDNWRRPKGHQSKMRKKIAGKGKIPSKGYRSPKTLRGKVDGKDVFYVKNISDLSNVPNGGNIIISSTLGTKKVSEMMPIIKEKKIIVINKNKLKKIYLKKRKIKEKSKKSKSSETKKENSEKNDEGVNNDKKNA